MQTRSSDNHCFYFLGWSSKQGNELNTRVETTVRYHKADVVYHGQVLMSSKRCHSWRPEANLRFDGDIVATAYFGMGAQESTGLTENFVFFTKRLSALAAVNTVLQDLGVDRCSGNVPKREVLLRAPLQFAAQREFATLNMAVNADN